MARLVRLAVLSVPIGALVLMSAAVAGAVNLPLATPAPPSAPVSAASIGSTQATAGAPNGGPGATASAGECPPPCQPSGNVQPGAQPTGATFTTGHGTSGGGDSSQAAAGAPHASGQGLLGSQADGSLNPSGGAAAGGICLSTISDLPVPGLNGSGHTCPAGYAAGGGTGSGSGSGGGGSNGAEQPGAAGAGGASGAAPGTAANACPAPQSVVITRTAATPLPVAAASIPLLGAAALALLSLFAGFALGFQRRGRALN